MYEFVADQVLGISGLIIACCRPAAEHQPQVMDDVFEPCRPTPSERNDVFSEPLREDPPAAMRHLACEAPREQSEAHLSAR